MLFNLPLFPLNMVLFPGMPLALHIFEARYKKMIGECIDSRKPFGVVLIRKGSEALGPLAEPYSVGCMAQITQVQRLDEGRMNIAAIGQERFRILSVERDSPYLVGKVEAFPLKEWSLKELAEAADKLRPYIKRYIEKLSQIEGVDLDPEQIPEAPIMLAYFGAGLLQIPSEKKQLLLSLPNGVEMLDRMREIYRLELVLVDRMLNHHLEDDNSFSLN